MRRGVDYDDEKGKSNRKQRNVSITCLIREQKKYFQILTFILEIKN